MKSNKNIFLFLIVFILIVSLGIASYFFFFRDGENGDIFKFSRDSDSVPEDVDIEKVYALSDLNAMLDGEVFWLLGKYTDADINTDDVESFELIEGEDFVLIGLDDFSDSLTIERDSNLLLEGKYDSNTFPYVFYASSISVLELDDYESLLANRYPRVEIEILDDEVVLNHGCENGSVDVKIKNVGELPVDYLKTGSVGTAYVFMGIVGDEVFAMFPDSNFDDPESTPVGYSYGFRDFGVLEPNQEKEVRFGLDGMVKDSYYEGSNRKAGTAGTNNIFCRGDSNEGLETSFSIKFGVVRRADRGAWVSSEYDFVNVVSSNEVPVEVFSCECDLGTESFPDPL